MATIEEYTGDNILISIRKTLLYFNTETGQLPDNEQSRHIRKKIEEFEPLLLTLDQVLVCIENADVIALGERVCRNINPESVYTESVFLDDLALAMIASGKAQRATFDDAMKSLDKHTCRPLIISRVSGRYQEICASVPSECVYWRAEKKGINCLKHKA
ncbi:hypothetical protein [Chlorobium limicola]